MTEVVKRLEPKKDTLREVFLKSGNECAFPGCTHKMISSSGVFMGEICHIEAAEKGGERFNASQTNEQRRHYDNLILMCHAHHKVTDDVAKYDVGRMKDIKSQHELKFTDIASTIQNAFKDQTDASDVNVAKRSKGINRVLGWNLSDDELRETNQSILDFSNRLRALPLQARQVLSIVVKRSDFDHINGLHISQHEMSLATGAENSQLREVLDILDQYSFIEEGFPDQTNRPFIQVSEHEDWNILQQLKIYCDAEGVELSELLVDLNFSVLD